MDTFWIDSAWETPLRQAHLNDLISLLMYTEGLCLSMHTRGSTFRSTLPNGQTVFIKRDHYTMLKDVMAQACHLQIPVAKSIRERNVLATLSQMGFQVPRVIAAGYRRKLGMPSAAGIVMMPLNGRPLDDFLRQPHTENEQREAIYKALAELNRLQDAGANWPDCKPEHFFLMPDGSIGLLDLERVTFQRSPLGDKLREKQRSFFQKRLPEELRKLMV